MGDQSFARLIKKRRDTLGFSQARLGELVGRSATTIRNWERGNSTPAERSDAIALAAVLGLDEREVLDTAGFEVNTSEEHPTMEQAYASLAPEPVPPPRSDRTSEPSEPTGSSPSAEAARAVEPDPAPEPPSTPQGPPRRPVDTDDRDALARPSLRDDHTAASPSEAEAEANEPKLSRAAPPTVLETAPPGEPSYLEDPEERQQYRVRALVTAAMVLLLLIVFLWSFDRATDALGTMWDDFFGMLDL